MKPFILGATIFLVGFFVLELILITAKEPARAEWGKIHSVPIPAERPRS